MGKKKRKTLLSNVHKKQASKKRQDEITKGKLGPSKKKSKVVWIKRTEVRASLRKNMKCKRVLSWYLGVGGKGKKTIGGGTKQEWEK